ncbi:MAG: glycosyltransferase family 4 protein [Henriciella sp.]
MTQARRIVHVLDDLAMGGVTRALQNFEHPSLTELGLHETVDIRRDKVRASSPRDIAVVHFTANWKKLAWLAELRLQGGFSRIILIEHSYTAGYEASEVAPKQRFRLMLKLAYSLVDTVVAVSHTQRDWILEHKLASAQKLIAIPQSRPCTDLLALSPARRQSGPLRLRAFGRFHKQKGFDLLIEAMSRIPAELAELKIAGTGPDEELLHSLASELPHVEICAPFTSPEAFLSEADVIAIPSRWEAFGLVGTEARAAGRPILAARIDGLTDQLAPSAFPHAPNNVASIVRAIYQAANAEDIDQRGLEAREHARGEYDRMITGWRAVLAGETRSYMSKTLSVCGVL